MNKLDFNGGAYRCEVVEGAIFEGNVGNLVAHFATDTITLHDRATRSAVSILSSRTENLQINGSVVSFEQAQTIIENALKQGGASSADAVTYDNTTSGLTATNVQSALDEVVANLGEIGDAVYLSKYLKDTTNPTINRQKMQELIDSGNPIIIDYNEVEFDEELVFGKGVRIASNTNSLLKFPNSSGFKHDGVHYGERCIFQGFQIKSKEYCFDFDNQGNIGVHSSIFRDLVLTSDESSCVYAGLSGNKRAFSLRFENIWIKAAEYGFYGLSGNTMYFSKIIDYGCGIAVFLNCSGIIDAFNGTFGGTPKFYQSIETNPVQQFRLNIRGSNLESYNQLFDATKGYFHINFDKVGFYVYDEVLDYPFKFTELFDFVFDNCYINYINVSWGDGIVLAQFRLGAIQCIRSNFEFRFKDTITDEIHSYTTDKKAVVTVPGGYRTEVMGNKFDYIDVKNIQVASITRSDKQYSLSEGTQALIYDESVGIYKIKCTTDTSDKSITLNRVSATIASPAKDNELSFIIRNVSTNAKVIIKELSGASGEFVNEYSGDIILSAGESVEVFWSAKQVNGVRDRVVVKRRFIQSKSGTTTLRPTPQLDQVGLQYYDSTLGKPIWWNGSAWVDSTGTAV